MTSAATDSTPWIRKAARWTLYLIGALAVFAIALYFAVPAIARHVLETRVAAQLQRPVTVERIAFNPLSLAARVDKLGIGARDGKGPALLALDTLTLDVSLASIWHWAPVFDRVTLERPRLSLARDADGTYSVQDLVDAALVDTGGPPARFSLNNIEVHGGAIDFDDRPLQRRHEIRDLNIGIPFLSSLPYQTTIKVVPHVTALVNGSPFNLSGTTTPFARTRDASLDIDIDALSLSQYLAYLPVKLRARVPSGVLSSRAKLVFSEGDPQSRALWLSGEFTLDNFTLQRPNGADTLLIARAAAHVARLDVFRRTLVVDSLRIDRPTLTARRAADGLIDVAAPWVEPPAKTAAPAVAADASPPWQVSVEKAAITEGMIRIEDNSVKPAYRVALSGFTLDATDLSNMDTKRAHLRMAMTSEFGATVKAEADLIPMTLEATGHIAVDKLSLRRFYPYYAPALDVDVQGGSLSVAGDFAHDPKTGSLAFTAGAASLDDIKLALRGQRAPLWSTSRLAVSGIVVDAASRRVEIGKVESHGGTLAVRRERDGSLDVARIVKAAPPDARAGASAPGWAVSSRQLIFDRYAIDIDDAVPTPAVAIKLRGVDVSAANFSNTRGKRGQLLVRAVTGDGGKIALEGPVGIDPPSARLRVDASGIALAPLQPYIDPYVGITVTNGKLAVNGQLRAGLANEAGTAADARTRFTGDVTVSSFAALDRPTRDDLARWDKLALTGVDATVDPPKLAIGAVTLEDFFARVILYDDATLNVVRLLSPQLDSADTAPAAVRASAATGAVKAAQPAAAAQSRAESPAQAPAAAAKSDDTQADHELPVSIGKITLARGNVRYSDFYVRPNYTADLADVAGTVSSMSATQAGNVDVAAKVARTAPVEVRGTINPFAREITLDLTGKASDIDLPPLSPYSVKYAGYGISKGTLSFDVHYKIDNRKLVASNRLKLDQLTFGEHVDSPTATRLPVLLAVALLKDTHGVIDLDLPISGSLDDPQFSVGRLIVQVIVNLITKAVTAPFALLGAMFGGGGEELSFIAFDPGSSGLPPSAADKVDTLGKALAARPALKVDIAGHSDATADAEAMRDGIVERMIRAQKVKALLDAGTPPPDAAAVVVSADERVRYLTAAYKEAPIKERPRNFIGFLKDASPADMEALLHAHASIGDDALRMLAQDRAQAVKQALVARGVAGERLFVVTGVAASTKGAPPTRVDLALK
ncbi:MAG: DUF748 domain-containing protein [Betaproteobacteria bacterium]